MRFDPETHSYFADDGTRIPSVTQIIQAAGLSGGGFYTPGSADRGALVHLAIEETIKFGRTLVDLSGEIGPYVDAYLGWIGPAKLRVIDSEKRVQGESAGLVYAGTVDLLVGDVTGDSIVIDFKTGRPAPWHRVQLAAYAAALGLELAGALYLGKEGKATLRVVSGTEILDAMDAWERACAAFRGGR